MKTSTTIRSWGALSLGIFFAAVTARTIFDDVWNGAPVTTAHVQSAAAIIAAIASGHMLWPVIKRAQIGAALGLLMIFSAATGYVVISAGARNAEAMQAKAATITASNDQRAAAERAVAEAEHELSDAKADYERAKAEAARECSTGKKTRCDGKIATRDAAAKDADKAHGFLILQRARLDVLKPKTDEHGGYAHAAKVIAALPFVTAKAEAIQASVELLLPFLAVLIAEVGTLTFGGMALGHKPQPASVPASVSAPANVNTFSGPKGPQGPRGKRKTRFPENVVPITGKHPVLAAIEQNGGTVASNRELARLMNVTDGEASKRVAEVAHLLSIAKVGKAVTMSLKRRAVA